MIKQIRKKRKRECKIEKKIKRDEMKNQLDLVVHHQMERFRVEENQNGNHHQRCTWIAQALTTKLQKQRENLQELLKTKQTVPDLEDRSCPKLRDHLAKKKVIPSQNE